MSRLAVSGLDVDLGSRAVLRGVGFDAAAGDVVGLIGPNGAGKTTLLRALCQLIPVRGGAVDWDGRPIGALDDRARARLMAYLPQGHAIHWPLTVRRLVGLGRLPRLGVLGRPGLADEQAVERAMATTDVAQFGDRLTSTLSGGERARALLARALAVEAPILLADEPTASLDPSHALDIMALLRRTAAEGALVIVVMHELGLVARFCDRVVLLDRGGVTGEGPPRAVLTPERLRAVYGIETATSPDLAASFAAALATATRTA